ncbi:MAG: DNA-processing protein DprA [Candidatus Portiera sp.]|nr:DNA-processing protein DprA [Portiera sp.]
MIQQREIHKDTLNEILAYEMLWAKHGMTQSKVTKLFSEDTLPSAAIAKTTPEAGDFYEELKLKIENYVTPRLDQVRININDKLEYPTPLRNGSPLKFLYCRGNIDLLESKSVAISGSRNASQEGISRAANLAKGLVEEGYTVVSGLAKGIDTSAHLHSIKNKGNTIGILGTPIDCYYPKENKELQDKIAQEHLLVSHVPFYRYNKVDSFPARSGYFPQRNKLIASLSSGIVVIEAKNKSGTVIQAREAIAQGKKLFILSSCLEAPSSEWAHDLVEKGKAIVVKELADVIDNL